MVNLCIEFKIERKGHFSRCKAPKCVTQDDNTGLSLHADLTKIHRPRIVRRHRGPRKYRDIATYSFDRQLSLLRYTTTATRRRRPPRCLGRGAPGIGSGRGVRIQAQLCCIFIQVEISPIGTRNGKWEISLNGSDDHRY